MPALWDRDEKTARQLLKQGGASMKDILTLAFGEWPPKGLDINANVPHSQRVTFKPLLREMVGSWQAKKGFWPRLWGAVTLPFKVISDEFSIAGRALLAGERMIWMNRLMCIYMPRLALRSSVVPTLGHEAVHSLQGDNYYRAAEVYGATGAQKIWASQCGTTSGLVMRELDDYESRFRRNVLTRAFHAAARGLSGCPGIGYLKTGVETQAFFHEALAAGYRKWGEMPQDMMGLWQALEGMGLKPPDDIRRELDARPADALSRKFSARARTSAARNLKVIDRSLSHEGREHFWKVTLPALYADLIEMYGDKKGRERFGMGPNTKGQIQAKAFGPG